MKTLRRYDIRNRYYFVTAVTQQRQKIMLRDIEIFWQSWNIPKPNAWVILPDHCHFIIKVDDSSISDIVGKSLAKPFLGPYNSR